MDIRGGEETEESTARFEIKMEIHPEKKRREGGEGKEEGKNIARSWILIVHANREVNVAREIEIISIVTN